MPQVVRPRNVPSIVSSNHGEQDLEVAKKEIGEGTKKGAEMASHLSRSLIESPNPEKKGGLGVSCASILAFSAVLAVPRPSFWCERLSYDDFPGNLRRCFVLKST